MWITDDGEWLYHGGCGCCESGTSLYSGEAREAALMALREIMRYCTLTDTSLQSLLREHAERRES